MLEALASAATGAVTDPLGGETVRVDFVPPRVLREALLRVVPIVLGGSCGMLVAGGDVRVVAVVLFPASMLIGMFAFLVVQRCFFPIAADCLPIVINDHGVTLPVRAYSDRVDRLPFDQVRAVVVVGHLWWRRLVVDGRARRYAYPLRNMAGPMPVGQLRRALLERIAGLPGGAERRAAMEARHALSQARGQAWPWATLVVLGVIGLVHGLQVAGGDLDAAHLIDFGGVTPLLYAGPLGEQWWRLVSGTMLHNSLWHLLANATVTLVFGTMLERLVGTQRTVIAMLVTGICGSLASVELRPLLPADLFPLYVVSAGSSAVVYGLIGAVVVLSWRFRAVVPPGMRLLRVGCLALLVEGAGVASAFVRWQPDLFLTVDHVAHAGGLVAGLLLGGVFGLAMPDARVRRRTGIGVRAGFIASLGVWGIALVLAAVHARDPVAARQDRATMAGRLLSGGIGPGEAVVSNNIAWSIAMDPDAPAAMLEQASELATRSVTFAGRARGNDGSWAAYSDTLAVVEYRRGLLDEPLRRLVPLLNWREDVDGHFAAVLDRVEREHGPQVWNGDHDDMPGFTLRDGVLRLDVPEALPAGARLYAVLRRRGVLAGLLTVQVPPGFVGARSLPVPGGLGAPRAEGPEAFWSAPDTEVVIGLFDRRGCSCPTPRMGPVFRATSATGGLPAWRARS